MPRNVGSSELRIHPLVLGGNPFGWTADRTASEQVLDAFVSAGGNAIDTADSYSSWVPGHAGGESETILGSWMAARGNRDRLVIATKVGAHPQFKGLAPRNVAAAAEASLKRLRTDRIDLYWAHFDDPETPLEDAVAGFDAVVRAGKVRYVGLSNLEPPRIEAWVRIAEQGGYARPIALQPHYNLVARGHYERHLAPVAERHRLGVFPYFALASGFLTGKYRSAADLEGKARGAGAGKYVTRDGLRVIAALEAVAAAHRASITTTALAWLLAKPTVTAPLASVSRASQLPDLLAAPELGLSADEVARLDEASRPFAEGEGDRT